MGWTSRNKEDTVLLCGQARLPQEMAPPFLFVIFVVVEKRGGRVIKVSCCPTAPLLEKFLQKVMEERSLISDLEDILQEMEASFFGRMKRAVITAIKDLHKQFPDFLSPKAEGSLSDN